MIVEFLQAIAKNESLQDGVQFFIANLATMVRLGIVIVDN